MLLTGGTDKTIKLWEPHTNKLLQTIHLDYGVSDIQWRGNKIAVQMRTGHVLLMNAGGKNDQQIAQPPAGQLPSR